jgi:hypothetical protein
MRNTSWKKGWRRRRRRKKVYNIDTWRGEQQHVENHNLK